MFGGIRVGEVTALGLDPLDPKQIVATMAVATETPGRADTSAGLDFQGLMGTAAIALQGGSASSPKVPVPPNGIPMLVADPSAVQSLTQAARVALQHVDGVMAGLEKMAGGAPAKVQPALYDLATPDLAPAAPSVPRAAIVIAEPTAAGYLQTQGWCRDAPRAKSLACPTAMG